MTDNSEKIESMKVGGQKLGRIIDQILSAVKPGVTTLELDELAEKLIIAAKAKPSFKTVSNYAYCTCIGLNQEVVHSIPHKDKKIAPGDLVKVDVGLIWQDWHTDMSWTIEVSDNGVYKQTDFLNAGKTALKNAVEQCKLGNRVGHISWAIQQEIESSGFQVVRQLTGHAVGHTLHEKPMIPGFLDNDVKNTPLLEEEMSLAIEVIYAQGKGRVVLENDGWTISTEDGKISGLFEQTVAVTTNGPLILTPISVGV